MDTYKLSVSASGINEILESYPNKQDKLTAGSNVEITDDNTINVNPPATKWGGIQGSISNQEDLKTALADKVNTSDLTSINTAINKKLDTPVRYVTETYVSGTSWFTLYSDGWCEQGGRYDWPASTDNQSTTIKLFKEYKDTNYVLTGGVYFTGTNYNGAQTISFSEITTKTFLLIRDVYEVPSSTISSGWVARGYILDTTEEE